jgi:hypothetical protein
MKLSIQETPEQSSLLEKNYHSIDSEPSYKNPNFSKYLSLFIIGVLTLIYSVAEIVIALKMESLALLTDGFHNLSDVIAIAIAYWAIRVLLLVFFFFSFSSFFFIGFVFRLSSVFPSPCSNRL